MPRKRWLPRLRRIHRRHCPLRAVSMSASVTVSALPSSSALSTIPPPQIPAGSEASSCEYCIGHASTPDAVLLPGDRGPVPKGRSKTSISSSWRYRWGWIGGGWASVPHHPRSVAHHVAAPTRILHPFLLQRVTPSGECDSIPISPIRRSRESQSPNELVCRRQKSSERIA